MTHLPTVTNLLTLTSLHFNPDQAKPNPANPKQTITHILKKQKFSQHQLSELNLLVELGLILGFSLAEGWLWVNLEEGPR
jgi:hypothetical protein